MKYLKSSFVYFLSLIVFSGSAVAQLDVDDRAIYDRMDRLERDITLLQRRVYKSDSDIEKKAVEKKSFECSTGVDWTFVF